MNLLTTHHRTRGNGPRTLRAADAGRKMGEMLAATPRAKPPSGKGQPKRDRRLRNVTDGKTPTLAALGITKRESAEAGRTGAVAGAVGVAGGIEAAAILWGGRKPPFGPTLESNTLGSHTGCLRKPFRTY